MTSLIGMVNINIGQQLISLPDASEATPMPRPLSVPLRQEIVRRRQQGLLLTQIAADLAIPYGLSFTHISLLTEVLTAINLAAILHNTVHLCELSTEPNENTITV